MKRNLFWLSDEQWARIEPHLPIDVRGETSRGRQASNQWYPACFEDWMPVGRSAAGV